MANPNQLAALIPDPTLPAGHPLDSAVPKTDAAQLALQACHEAMQPVIAMIVADPYRSGLGYLLLTEHLNKMIAAMAQAKRAMR